MPFQYDKLPNDSYFRVFKLKPGEEGDVLQGTLATYLREKAPSYEALSYVWGPANYTSIVNCNNQCFEITDSLDAALRRLRLNTEPRYLWIDQICINQSCKPERSEQVSIMGHIYSDAAIVNAWLGPADPEEAAHAARLVFTLANLKNHVIQTHRFPKNEQLQELGLPTRDSPAWNALNSMLSVPYFSRVWIIQELVMASIFVLLWGSITISKDDFESCRKTASSLEMSDSDGTKGCPQLKWDLISTAFLGNKRTKEKNLFDLVALASQSQATDPRDKIFALVGLAKGRTYYTVPDYTKTEQDVFAGFATNVISMTGNLEILDFCYVEDPDCATRHPFWAPRWLPEVDNPVLMAKRFTASNNIEATLGVPSDNRVLGLRGLEVDVVMDTSDRISNAYDSILAANELATDYSDILHDRYVMDTIRPILLTMMAGESSHAPFGAPPDDDSYLNNFLAYAMLVLRQSFHKENYSEELRRAFLQLAELAIDTRPSATQGEPKWTTDEIFEFYEDNPPCLHPDNGQARLSYLDMFRSISSVSRENGLDFLRDISVSFDRKLFVTKKGYIGLGPACMEPGDTVCILFGGFYPYIVRQTTAFNDGYLFLGCAYVQGIMDGEAVTTWKEQEDSQDQEFQVKMFNLQ